MQHLLGFDQPRPQAGPASSSSHAGTTTRRLAASGHDRDVRFLLQRIEGGLYVEREDVPRRGLHTLQSLRFSTIDAFRRWCDDDPLRFDQPLLHHSLVREAGSLWAGPDHRLN